MKQLLKDSFLYSFLFLLLLASLSIPLALITVWFLPLPFFILFVRQHWKATGISSLVLATLLLFVHPIACLFVLYAFLIGSVMGRNYRNPRATGTDVLLSGIVIACICSWLFLIVGETFFDMINQMRKMWEQFPQEQMPNIETILPSFLFIPTVITPFCILFTGRYLLSKQGYAKKYLPLFRNWRLPRLFVYFYACFILYLLITEESPLLVGIVLILQVLFTVQGLSFTAFLLHFHRKNKLLLLPISLTIFVPLLSTVVLLLGIIDTSFRVRERLIAKK